MKTNDIFIADFETTTDENDCRVWAAGVTSLDCNFFDYGNSIDWFFKFCFENPNSIFYFHNLKFDGTFILNHIFRKGFVHTKDKKLNVREFTTLISDMGQFYIIKIKLSENNTVTIYDSLKILPFSVAVIAKSFGLDMEKGEIDYTAFRPVGHILTDDEIYYLKRDVQIVAKALSILFEQGLDRITAGSNAFNDFKSMLGRRFRKLFPVIPCDKDIRQAYRGGFTFANPDFAGKDMGKGMVLDKNSMYPSMMLQKPLPYGEPIFFEGEYKQDRLYNLYVQMFSCIFELKEGYFPTVQIKNKFSGFLPTEYITSSNGEEVSLCMTNVDLKLFLEHYEILGEINYISGWKFKSTTGLFDDYINKWYQIKEESTRNGNAGMRTLAKLMLNSLYGKFALNPEVRSKIPYFDDGQVKYVFGEKETREGNYLPVAVFITSYSRDDIIRNAQKVRHRFLYADTDSLHLKGNEFPEGLDIDNYRIGAWKIESHFIKGRYLRAKSYIEYLIQPIKYNATHRKGTFILKHFGKNLYSVKQNVTCAGMPKSCHKNVNWDNFHYGASYEGKLQFHSVKNGVVLRETPFVLKSS